MDVETPAVGPSMLPTYEPNVFYACFTEPVAENLDAVLPHLSRHKAWIKDLEKTGRIVLAGPFLTDDGDYSGTGLIVIRADDAAEAEAVMGEDPMHTSGVRRLRIVPWQLNEGTVTVSVDISTRRATFA